MSPLHLVQNLRFSDGVYPGSPYTDKIILPQSILQGLLDQSQAIQIDLPSPLTFQLTNPENGKYTNVGIREFSADEGQVFIPPPVASTLLSLKDGDFVQVQLVELPRATSMTLKPIIASQVSDWKTMLERQLNSTHTALTKGDVLTVPDPTGGAFEFLVEQLEPADAVCIVDTDVDLHINEVSASNNSVGASDLPTVLTLDEPVSMRIQPGQSIHLRLDKFNASKDLSFHITRSEQSATGLVAGFIDSTSKHEFEFYSIMGSQLSIPADKLANKSTVYLTAYSEDADTVSVEVLPSQGPSNSAPSTTLEANTKSGKQCPNCKQYIPEQSFQLHTTFCARNNVVCECGKVFQRQIPEDHWHCLEHSVNGTSENSKQLHDLYFHTPQKCTCGQELASKALLAVHRATACPNGLHICRFCHLKVPRDEPTAVDRLEGLSGHEGQCGNRTTECHICGKTVRLRELESHLQLHDFQRKSRPTPKVCTNVNCARVASTNNGLGLCDFCFGPLHSTQYDPTGAKLNARIERRYVIQLTRGCGKPWCTNQFCATNMAPPPMNQVIEHAQKLTKESQFYFCVDEMTTKRKTFVQLEAGEYEPGWVVEAIEKARGNEAEARRWLENHAVKIGEA